MMLTLPTGQVCMASQQGWTPKQSILVRRSAGTLIVAGVTRIRCRAELSLQPEPSAPAVLRMGYRLVPAQRDRAQSATSGIVYMRASFGQ